jgi:hypothetical protein
MTKGDKIDLFGITGVIAAKLKETNPGCSFQFICDPPVHITVIIVETIVPVINPPFVIWAHSQLLDTDKPNFLTSL